MITNDFKDALSLSIAIMVIIVLSLLGFPNDPIFATIRIFSILIYILYILVYILDFYKEGKKQILIDSIAFVKHGLRLGDEVNYYGDSKHLGYIEKFFLPDLWVGAILKKDDGTEKYYMCEDLIKEKG